jgi:transcription initiation factor TFIIIB Brf1 subunit/transcription initiation factor TFIIB
MKDKYGRKLQCPKCNSKKISFVQDAEERAHSSGLLYCQNCGKIGCLSEFRAIPSSENPSRRDSDVEDPNEPNKKIITVITSIYPDF